MLTTKSGRFSILRAGVASVLLFLGFVGSGYGYTAKENLTKGLSAMQQGNYPEAIERLEEYLYLSEGATADRAVATLQDVRYTLSRLLISEGRKEDAIEYLEKYVNERFATHMRKAYFRLAICTFESEEYEKCIESVEDALEYNENPIIMALPTTDDEEEEDEFAGVEEMEEPDDPYTSEELSILRYVQAESYFKLERFEESIKPFTYVVEHTTDELEKGYAIMQMINALLKQDAFDRIMAWVPQLYRTSARYDIRVNLALMNAAEILYDRDEYDSALPLYRMIVPKDELLAYQEQHLEKLLTEEGLPPEMGQELTPEEEWLYDNSEAMAATTVGEEPEDGEKEGFDIPDEIKQLQELLATLRDVAPYENYVNLQMAEVYKSVKRYWEAIRFYETVYKASSNPEVRDPAVYEAVNILTDSLAAGEEAEKLAMEFFESQRSGVYPRLVAYLLTMYYQANQEWQSILNLRPYIQRFDQVNNIEWRRFDSELDFMQGVGELMLGNYSNAVDRFQIVLDNYPGMSTEPHALYWCGFSYLTIDAHEEAYNCFDRYTREFPGGQLIDEAYYQSGVALFGQDMLDEAQRRFTYVIETFGTNSVVYSDACNMRGDILGSLGGENLDLAVQDYTNALHAAKRAAQATYATFGMCEIFQADEQFYGSKYIEKWVNLYLAEWGDRGADLAKAQLWLGRARIQREDYLGAVESYYNTLVEYGGTLQQEGVDQIIPELVKIASVFLNEEQRNNLKTRMQVQIDSTENTTLQLRLRVTLAKFNDTEDELGQQLISELEDFRSAPPPVLASICKAALETKDYTRSEELVNIFKEEFEDSVFIRSAYQLLATGQFENGDLEGALETLTQTQEDFGTAPEVAWAQLLKARILFVKGDLELAREENKNVMGVPEWRGAPFAQATFQLGEIEEAAGNLLKAHSYYQRVYYQYRGVAAGRWGAKGYLAAAECLKKLAEQPSMSSYEQDIYLDGRRKTLQAMLLDRYANTPGNADLVAKAKELLGSAEVEAIQAVIDAGTETNIVVNVEADMAEPGSDKANSEKGGPEALDEAGNVNEGEA